MFKRISGWLVTIIGVNLVFIGSCGAASFYVRSGAASSNNGLDWNNAWNKTSSINFSVLNPGDTVYIGAGTYGSLSVSRSGSAGKPISFKRATASEHGTSTGWSDSYDGRVIIDGGDSTYAVGIGEAPAYSAQNYITIDGATKYGIWLRNAEYGVRAAYGSNNLTLRYLEIGNPGSYKMGEDGIQGKGSNLLIEYSYIHDNDNQTTHGDGLQWFEGNGITIRYNTFKNSGQIMMMGVKAWGAVVNDVSIYYNLFYNRGGGHYNGLVFDANSPQSGRYVNVYNNTFDLEAKSNSGYDSIFYPLTGAGTISFKNNAVIASNAGQVNKTEHSNNAYDNSGEYVVYNIPNETEGVSVANLGLVSVGNDYRLTAGSPLIGKGVDVGLRFDFDGKAVPVTPSIGAFESATVTGLPAPTNLRIQP